MAGIKDKNPQDVCSKILDRMEETTVYRPDVVCMPETFPFANCGGKPNLAEVAEERSGPILDRFADFARRHHCYVICSTYTKSEGRHYNAAVLLDREGHYVGEYRKINPDDEELAHGVTPGPLQPPTFDTDFGRIGMQICYDANWYDNWHKLGEAGAQIVFWPSFFAGGMMLNSHAWMNKYYVVSSILNGTRQRWWIPSVKKSWPLAGPAIGFARHSTWITRLFRPWAILKRSSASRESMAGISGFDCCMSKPSAMIQGVSGSVSVAEALKEFDIPTTNEMFAASTREQNAKRPEVNLKQPEKAHSHTETVSGYGISPSTPVEFGSPRCGVYESSRRRIMRRAEENC